MGNPARLQGTAWHKEFLKKKENDPRRHRARCLYYCEDNQCGQRFTKCSGSAHCALYKDGYIEAETRVQRENKEKKVSWKAVSPQIPIPELIQLNDTVILKDMGDGETFQITLNREESEAPELQKRCLGKYVGDRVSVNEYTYIIIQLRKTNGDVYYSHKKGQKK